MAAEKQPRPRARPVPSPLHAVTAPRRLLVDRPPPQPGTLLSNADQRIIFAITQIFHAGFFTDRAVPAKEPRLRCLAASWPIRLAVYGPVRQAAYNWHWAFPHVTHRLVPWSWARRISSEAGVLCLCLAAGHLPIRDAVATRAVSWGGILAEWVATRANDPIRALATR